jgi:Cu(I)/Ag(I) efflux system membrane protein CusA/SilA
LGCNEEKFFKIVKLGFNQRRKTLRNSLKSILVTLEPGIPFLTKRPEELSVEQFILLCNYLEENKTKSIVKEIQKHLVLDEKSGQYFRQWRDQIKSPDDIWDEIQLRTSGIPGVTSAPKLQPIETRLVMLQTGMRAPMGMKVYGPDLETIENFSLKLENLLQEVPSVKAEAVFADRSLGKPYLEVDLDRVALGRYGLNVADVQEFIEVAIGGMTLSTTVEGRERYAIRARYAREYRDDPEVLKKILVNSPTGAQIPLGQIAEITYRPGPMMIRGENTFLVGYVMFDKRDGYAEVNVVESAKNLLDEKVRTGELVVPAGVSYVFSGSYENQIRAEKRLALVIPLCTLPASTAVFASSLHCGLAETAARLRLSSVGWITSGK